MNNNEFAESYGSVALITGASSGIGKSFAKLLAAKGLDLVLVARRKECLDELAAELMRQFSIQVTTCMIDLSAAEAAEQILAATAAMDIGLVVSNAGFAIKGNYDSTDPHLMTKMLNVNCHTPMLLARGFVPRLRQRGRGGILFTSSIEALLGCPYSSAYSASKSFINNLGEGLWAELNPEGIDVLVLCPGATDTEALTKQGIDPASLPNLMAPEDVAAGALQNINNGPVYISSEHYESMFEKLLAMPRRDALLAMAGSMKP